jgi:hypothetical protein
MNYEGEAIIPPKKIRKLLCIPQEPINPEPLCPPFDLRSLFRRPPYMTHKFHEFVPNAQRHYTHAHSLEHAHFCRESYYQYHN